MKHCLALLIGLWLSAAACAAGSDVCGSFTAERDGIRCKVDNADSGATLLVRVHAKKGDSPERIAAAKAATRRAIDAFIAQGGVFIKMRSTRGDGVEIERACSKVKGKRAEHCGEWAPV